MNYLALDTDVYPSLSKYLSSLPFGLDSYPDVLTRAFYSIELRKRLGEALTSTKLPHALRTRISENWRNDDWIPATIYASLTCLAKDTVWKEPDLFHRNMFDVASVMYASVLFKTIMFIFSPSLMAMGAAKRWGSFHKGTSLTVSHQTKESAWFELEYPQRLFSEVCLRSLGATFDCAISGAGAKNFSYDLNIISDSRAIYAMKWTF